MKKIILLSFVLIAIILTSGCVINVPNSITGNGNVITKERSVSEFSGVKVETGIDVYLTQGNDQHVEVEADENLHEWIRTEVNGDVLHIYSEKSIRNAKTKRVNITCKTLNRIDISSAGDVKGQSKFKVDQLDIEMSSAGDLELDVEADRINISLSSAGDADLSGTTNILNVDLSSAGDLNAFDLMAKTGEVTVSSAGNARVYITDEASFRSSSAGNIQYKGEPRLKDINTSSAGSVNKRD